MKNFKEVCILDVCHSDFFSGYQYPTLQIPLINGSINGIQFHDSILDEINMLHEYLIESFSEEDMDLFRNFAEKVKNDFGSDLIYSSDEPIEEEDDEIYVYISLCNPVYKYGMSFLNE